MEDDYKMVPRHGIDRLDKDMRTSQVQDRVSRKEADLAFILEDATAILEPLEPAVEAVEPTKVIKGDSMRRKEIHGMIASALQ